MNLTPPLTSSLSSNSMFTGRVRFASLRRLGWPAASCVVMWLAVLPGMAGALPRATPESQGMSSVALNDLVATLDRRIEGMHSLMIVRHGRVIAEGWWRPYAAERNHVLYSLSKSFTSTAVGIAVAEGRLSIDDEVLKFFPGQAPDNPGANLKAMRVRDLLTMATGHQDEPPSAPDAISARSFLAQPVPHLPGTHFKYNTPATFMLSAIVQQLTGQTVFEYLRPRLFEPLGIERPVWDTNFEGISLGGYGLRVRTEDIAKFGQLFLDRGQWQGKPLLTPEWVALATSRQVSNGSNPASDWNQGYGFQFWRCRHHAYRGDGAFGQYCVVLPGQDVVVAITSGVRDMQAVLNVLWEKLLPACGQRKLRADRGAQAALARTLGGLTLATAGGSATGPQTQEAWTRRFTFPQNDQGVEELQLSAGTDPRTLQLRMKLGGQEVQVACGYRTWGGGSGPMPAGRLASFKNEPLAASYGWQEDGRLQLRLCAPETPFTLTFQLRFEDARLTLDAEANAAFGPTRWPTLVGAAR